MNKTELSRLREIPLDTVLEALGAERDPADPTRNWRTAAGRITVTNTKFYNHDEQVGGGGAIDLTQHVGGYSFKDALAFLGSVAGPTATIQQYRIEAEKHAKRILDTTPAPKQEIPVPDASKLNRVRGYLTETRAIPEPIVEKAIAKGRLWADRFGNAVFALHDPNLTGEQVGAELRGTYDKPFHGVRGAQKGMFFTGVARPPQTGTAKAVFVESAVEALSYEALNPNALVVSTTGCSKEQMIKTAVLLAERKFQIVAGFNNDKDGDRFAKWLTDAIQGVERQKPESVKDWNDALRAQREHSQARDAAQNRGPTEEKDKSAQVVRNKSAKEREIER